MATCNNMANKGELRGNRNCNINYSYHWNPLNTTARHWYIQAHITAECETNQERSVLDSDHVHQLSTGGSLIHKHFYIATNNWPTEWLTDWPIVWQTKPTTDSNISPSNLVCRIHTQMLNSHNLTLIFSSLPYTWWHIFEQPWEVENSRLGTMCLQIILNNHLEAERKISYTWIGLLEPHTVSGIYFLLFNIPICYLAMLKTVYVSVVKT